MFLTLIIPALLSIWTPILVSNTITAITVYDFNLAIQQTTFEFLILIVSAISYFIYHIINSKVNRIIITNFQNYVYCNVKNNKNIKHISIDILQSINSCSTFNKNIIYKSCFFIKSIIILIIIFNYNNILSLSIVVVSIVSYLLLRLTDKRIKNKNQELSKLELESLNLFNSICDGNNAEKNYNLEDALKNKYFKYVEENIKTTNQISLFYNINNNFISLILKATVFASTLYLISLVKNTTLTLSIYLILTPYLTSSAENLISFFDIFSEIALMDNTLQQFKALKFQTEPEKQPPIELCSYNIYLYKVTAKNNSKIKDINLTIKHKNLVCFVGDVESEKIDIFKMLTQKITPELGSVFIDEKNIHSIPTPTFNSIVSSTTTDEHFFNISIFENLFLVCSSRQKIFKAINSMGLTNKINSLPQKINTIMNENVDDVIKFFIGIARSFLSSAKIINIYNFPRTLSQKDKTLFKNILLFLKSKCTVICYFDNIIFDDIFDNVIFVENNKLKIDE